MLCAGLKARYLSNWIRNTLETHWQSSQITSRYPSRTLRDCDVLKKPCLNSNLPPLLSAKTCLRRPVDFLSKVFLTTAYISFQDSFRNTLLCLPGTFRDSVFLANWYQFGRESDKENTQGEVSLVDGPVCSASRAGGLGPWAIAHQAWLFSFSLPDTLPAGFRTAGRLFLWKFCFPPPTNTAPWLPSFPWYVQFTFRHSFRNPLFSLPGSFRDCMFLTWHFIPTSWKINAPK